MIELITAAMVAMKHPTIVHSINANSRNLLAEMVDAYQCRRDVIVMITVAMVVMNSVAYIQHVKPTSFNVETSVVFR